MPFLIFLSVISSANYIVRLITKSTFFRTIWARPLDDRLTDKRRGHNETANRLKPEPPKVPSAEKLAVRAKPGQSQGVGVGLAVNQQQVGLDVAFTVACLIVRKVVIAVACIQRLIGCQCEQHRSEYFIERAAVLALSVNGEVFREFFK